MGKEQKGGQPNRFKKQYNNYNPYNKLQLNKYHQVNNKQNNYGHQLNKKKRDIERMIEYRRKKGLEVDEQKVGELEQVQQEVTERKRDFEKEKRKEFFIETKYKQVMNIEKRKVAHKLREIKATEPIDQAALAQWYKKLNYIKNFPKTLKYVALFPNTPLSDKAREFQEKIMSDIEASLAKKNKKLNAFEPEYKVSKQKPKKKKDDFFLQDVEVSQGNEGNEEVQSQPQQSQQQASE